MGRTLQGLGLAEIQTWTAEYMQKLQRYFTYSYKDDEELDSAHLQGPKLPRHRAERVAQYRNRGRNFDACGSDTTGQGPE